MKKILFINQECIPYVPENDMSTLGKMVPKAIQESGCEIRTFMPKWGVINERRGQLHEVIRLSGVNISIDDMDYPLIIKVASIPQTKIQVYFIDNEELFSKRGMVVDEEGNPYSDNGERAIFFARGVIETIKKLRWAPDVIHCQGWMSAFVPMYLKKAYADEPVLNSAKIVTSFFDDTHRSFIADELMKQRIAFREVTADVIDGYNDVFTGEDLARLAIEYSDGVIEATPNVAPAIKDMIKNSGVKHMPYTEGDLAQIYNDFYNSL